MAKKQEEFDMTKKVEVNQIEDIIIKVIGGLGLLVLILVAFEVLSIAFAFIAWGIFAAYFIWLNIKYFVLKKK